MDNPFTRRDVGNVFSIFYVGGGAADAYQVKDVPHGQVRTVWYHSNAADADRRMNVYLPAGYGKTDKKSPVFYLLHGSGGDENAWVELGNIVRIMDNLIAEGKCEPMIVVMPNGNLDGKLAKLAQSKPRLYWIACGDADRLMPFNKQLMERMTKEGLMSFQVPGWRFVAQKLACQAFYPNPLPERTGRRE